MIEATLNEAKRLNAMVLEEIFKYRGATLLPNSSGQSATNQTVAIVVPCPLLTTWFYTTVFEQNINNK